MQGTGQNKASFQMQIYSCMIVLAIHVRCVHFRQVKKMVNSCVAANCTHKWCLSRDISLHKIPYFNDDRPEAKRKRKIWVDFVKPKHVFVPSKASTLCSAHLMPEDL